MDGPQLASQPASTLEGSSKLAEASKPGKAPVVRGARACTVCRTAKMKCVGAEDGQPCQRCKRSGAECVFEKHRRGRKPGSKLSEASKMLRRLEKGLNSAKLKSQSNDSPFVSDSRPGDRFPNNELPPLNLPPDYESTGFPTSAGPRSGRDDDENDNEKSDEGLFPAKLISKEQQRNSFFKTILNPEPYEPTGSRTSSERSFSADTPRAKTPALPSPNPPPTTVAVATQGVTDPVTAGLMEEAHANMLFDLFFLRLNPFINLFDPALHNVNYIRSRCPFLFTVILMACCKFFDPEKYKPVQQLARELAVHAFAENWKRVEVCQAFACLTYWKEPDDQRTWTYIGYACRMAVELGLNRYVGKRPAEETDLQLLERRNRERTYLVLFVHDRSLSTQTGRQWMLPECELVRHSTTWHEEGGSPIRPEDVILAAFVQLRGIASETTELCQPHRGVPTTHADMNYEVILRNCNSKLSQWAETWENEMRRANGEKFHFAFLSFFRLYVRLFLNSFGIQASMSSNTRASPSLAALTACYTSALDSLQIINKEFASISMLRYGQESITTMTAYSAVFLLKLLRSSNTHAQLHEGATDEIYTHISRTADAYHEASMLAPASSSSAASHARFLRSLVVQDVSRARRAEKERQQQNMRPHEPRAPAPYGGQSSYTNSQLPPSSSSSHYLSQPMQSPMEQQNFHFSSQSAPTLAPPHPIMSHAHPREPEYPASEAPSRNNSIVGYPYTNQPQQIPSQLATPPQHHASSSQQAPYSPFSSESDQHYSRLMFREMNELPFVYGGMDDGTYGAMNGQVSNVSGLPVWNGAVSGSGTSYQQHEGQGHSGPSHGSQGVYAGSHRHYQPYPPPSYNSHSSHGPGYSGLVGR